MFSLLSRSQMPSIHKFRKHKVYTFRSPEILVPETMANVPQSRMLRFCLILITVILTIFIYATYSTNDMNLPLPSLRTAALIASSRGLGAANPHPPSSSSPLAQKLTSHPNLEQHSSSKTNTMERGKSGKKPRLRPLYLSFSLSIR